jgi:hypothetical protein
MAKFKFELEVGFFGKDSVRDQLNRSKAKLEYTFGGNVSITETKEFLGGRKFLVVGTGFPDTQEFVDVIRDWEKKIKNAI